MKVGLDTSVVLRLLTGLPPDQFDVARRAVQAAVSAGDQLVIGDLAVAEAYFALHHHYAVPKDEARRLLRDMLSSGVVVTEPGSAAAEALAAAGGAGLVDRLLHGRYTSLGASTWTFDDRLRRLPGATRPPS